MRFINLFNFFLTLAHYNINYNCANECPYYREQNSHLCHYSCNSLSSQRNISPVVWAN
nr:MAG TPA: hypothetical protein [Caudoviricetes sp.]